MLPGKVRYLESKVLELQSLPTTVNWDVPQYRTQLEEGHDDRERTEKKERVYVMELCKG